MKNDTNIPTSYSKRIEDRSRVHYCLGYIIRLYNYIRFGIRRRIVKLKGGKIGCNSLVPLRLAIRANKNLIIGNNVSINTSRIDLRRQVVIEDNVIINRDVEIIRLSHDYNSPEFALKEYPSLVIEPYSWLATGCKILPSCSKISYGSIIGAFSVLPYSTDRYGVYSGFPAIKIKEHQQIWDNMVVVSMNGGDWDYYRRVKVKR